MSMAEQGHPQEPGNQSNKEVPSVADFFLQTEPSQTNMIREMVTTSDLPNEFIPRSHVSLEESAAMRRIMVSQSLWRNEDFRSDVILWMRLAFSIAEEGRGRGQAERMYTGGFRQRLMDKLRGRSEGSAGDI